MATRQVVYVVLVDGNSTRVIPDERKKPEGPSNLERVGSLLEDHAVEVVAEHAVEGAVTSAMPFAHVLLAAAPMIGMLASVAMASKSIDPKASIGVLPADRPGVRKDTLDRCERAFDGSSADVAYPVAGGQAGYPVYLSPEARERLAQMPEGDLLKAVQSDASLQKLAVDCRDVGIYLDLGTPEQRREAERRLAEIPSIERSAPRT
jgi:CTP:molybdopterin cytidylyltransferase MocA